MSSDQVVLAAGSGRGPDLNVRLIDDQPIEIDGLQLLRAFQAAEQKIRRLRTKKRQELEIKLKHLLAEASIDISGAVSAGVVLRMGDKTLTVPEDLHGAAFQKVAEGISWSERG